MQAPEQDACQRQQPTLLQSQGNHASTSHQPTALSSALPTPSTPRQSQAPTLSPWPASRAGCDPPSPLGALAWPRCPGAWDLHWQARGALHILKEHLHIRLLQDTSQQRRTIQQRRHSTMHTEPLAGSTACQEHCKLPTGCWGRMSTCATAGTPPFPHTLHHAVPAACITPHASCRAPAPHPICWCRRTGRCRARCAPWRS